MTDSGSLGDSTEAEDVVQDLNVPDSQIRLLVLSGQMDDTFGRHGISNEELLFLHKPFTADVLAGRVREVLNPLPAASSAADR